MHHSLFLHICPLKLPLALLAPFIKFEKSYGTKTWNQNNIDARMSISITSIPSKKICSVSIQMIFSLALHVCVCVLTPLYGLGVILFVVTVCVIITVCVCSSFCLCAFVYVTLTVCVGILVLWV